VGASGKIRVHPFFTEDSTGAKDVYVGLLESDGGGEIPRHSHEGSEEILYVLAGDGELTVGSDKIKFGREQAIHIPADQPHAIKFHGDEKGLILQAFAPGGPEKERFKPTGKARSK
jgi:quercetin dioxygenase-like cupin family protein